MEADEQHLRQLEERREVDLANALANAKKIADELSAVDDALSARIPVVEQALQALRIGIPLSVEFEDSDTGAKLRLHFCKHKKGEWRLMVDYGEETQMLTNAPRNIRALGFAALPFLVESMAAQIDAKIVERRDTLADVDAVIAALNAVRK